MYTQRRIKLTTYTLKPPCANTSIGALAGHSSSEILLAKAVICTEKACSPKPFPEWPGQTYCY